MADSSGRGGAGAEIVTVDRLLAHVAAVPAVAGQPAELFLREKAHAGIAHSDGAAAPESRVVLMVHGGFWPSTLAFDFGYPGYSWMAALAAAGFDVFALDMTGYGFSSRPTMDDPANLSDDDRAALFPELPPAAPSYPYRLATSDSEAADIDCAVDYIRALRGVERVSLIGWSGGGIRTGTYTARHPDKIDRLVIFASSNYVREGPDGPPAVLPEPGRPVNFQTRAVGIGRRWEPNIRCPGQVAPGIKEILWRQTLLTDPVGASWGPGGLRAPSRTYWGWNRAAAQSITQPTLVMVGEFDRLLPSNIELFADLGAESKAFLRIGCASHFAAWEMQRRVLHDASLQWLRDGTLCGARQGRFAAAADGRIGAFNDTAET